MLIEAGTLVFKLCTSNNNFDENWLTSPPKVLPKWPVSNGW